MKQQLTEIRRLQELAGVDDRTAEFNSLEDSNVFNDVPSIEMTIQTDENGQDVLFMKMSTFYHGGGNKKISIMKGDKAKQELVMQVMQAEMQKTFRNVIHSILGEPYGIPERKK